MIFCLPKKSSELDGTFISFLLINQSHWCQRSEVPDAESLFFHAVMALSSICHHSPPSRAGQTAPPMTHDRRAMKEGGNITILLLGDGMLSRSDNICLFRRWIFLSEYHARILCEII